MFIVGLCAGRAAASVLANPGFESGALAPWTQNLALHCLADPNWMATNADAHTGSFSATVFGNKRLIQTFAGVAASQISELSLWLKQPEGQISAVELRYSDLTTDTNIVSVTPAGTWTFHDLTSQLDGGKTLVALAVWGYFQDCVDDVTFLDDVTISVCGDGDVTQGEQCDDGNALNGDCCDSGCQYELAGSACDDAIFCNGTDSCDGAGACQQHSGDPCSPGAECTACNEGAGNCFVPAATPCDDGDLCTGDDVCDGAGGCSGGPALDCDDGSPCTQDSCASPTTCVNDPAPRSGCKAAGKSLLLLKNNATDSKDTMIWKWLKGSETTLAELGTPSGTTDYALCLHAGASSVAIAVPAGPSWAVLGTKGFKYRDTSGVPHGAQKAVLKSGSAGRAKALVKGKGANLPDALAPELPLPVTAQLINETGTCFEAVYGLADVIRNDAQQFKAKRQ